MVPHFFSARLTGKKPSETAAKEIIPVMLLFKTTFVQEIE